MLNTTAMNEQNSEFWSRIDSFLDQKEKEVKGPIFGKFKFWKETIKEFEASKPGFSWCKDTLIQVNLDEYAVFLHDSKGHAPNTVTKYMKCFKNFLDHAYPLVQKDFIHTTETTKLPIALTQDELDTLLSISLIGSESKVLDIFCVLCLTGMDYKDYVLFDNWSIGMTQIEYCRSRQNVDAIVPVNNRLLSLVEKYQATMPTFAEPFLNRSLKKIFKAHGFDRMVSDQQTGENLQPLYKKITLSVGRHTFIQHCIDKDLPAWDITKMCGLNSMEKLSLYKYPFSDDPGEMDRYARMKWNMRYNSQEGV